MIGLRVGADALLGAAFGAIGQIVLAATVSVGVTELAPIGGGALFGAHRLAAGQRRQRKNRAHQR